MTTAVPTDTSLRPPWVHLARAGWVLLAFACLGLFLDSVIHIAQAPLPSCAAPGAACPASTQVTREDADIAAALGLPVPLLPLSLAFSILARLSLAVVGLIIFWRRSEDWMALVLSGALLTVLLEGVQGISPSLHLLQGALFGIGTALFLPIPFLFPTGHFEPPWMRWPVIALTVPYVILVTFFLYSPRYAGLTAVLTLLWVGLSLYAMPYRYFRVSGPVERQQIKWVLLGISASFVTAIYYSAVTALYPITQPSPARVLLLLVNLPLYLAGYGFFAFAILVAMLRYRLWDIDLIIRRTLVYSALTALLALTYFGLVIILQNAVTALPAPAAPYGGAAQVGGARSEWVTVASTLAVAALFAPLRGRIQAFIDQRFYRQKYDAAQTLAAFAAVARDETDLNALTQHLIRIVQATMQPEHAAVWLAPRPADAGSPSTTSPEDRRPPQ